MSRDCFRDVPDPFGGVQKVCAKKVRAHFSFPNGAVSRAFPLHAQIQILDMTVTRECGAQGKFEICGRSECCSFS